MNGSSPLLPALPAVGHRLLFCIASLAPVTTLLLLGGAAGAGLFPLEFVEGGWRLGVDAIVGLLLYAITTRQAPLVLTCATPPSLRLLEICFILQLTCNPSSGIFSSNMSAGSNPVMTLFQHLVTFSFKKCIFTPCKKF